MNSGDSERAQLLRALGLVTGIGALFAVSVGIGLGLGLLLARLVGGGAVPVAGGVIVGVVAGGRGVYRMVMREFGTR